MGKRAAESRATKMKIVGKLNLMMLAGWSVDEVAPLLKKLD